MTFLVMPWPQATFATREPSNRQCSGMSYSLCTSIRGGSAASASLPVPATAAEWTSAALAIEQGGEFRKPGREAEKFDPNTPSLLKDLSLVADDQLSEP